MERQDFTVYVCENCGKVHCIGYLLEDDELPAVGDCCEGAKINPIPYEQWGRNETMEVLENLLEDDNRHNLTDLGHLFEHQMKQAGASNEVIDKALRGLLDYYSENHSLHFPC